MISAEYASTRSLITQHIEIQIQILRRANLTFDGWKAIIHQYDNDDQFSPFAVFDLRIKAFYMQHLYIKAQEYYDTIGNFNDIASLAILEANKNLSVFGTERANLHIITHPKTLMKWFRLFRESDSFPNTSKLRSAKSKMPLFLSSNPEVSESILSFCKTNISTLSIESVLDHIHEHVIQNLVKTIQEQRDDKSYNKALLFKEFRLKKLTLMTVCNWMHLFGLKYEDRRKSYYVDNHEKPENIKYRRDFIKRYFAYELRCYR